MKLTPLSLVLATSLFALPLSAYADQSDQPLARIVVSATGTQTMAPDMATLNLSVLREAKTAATALRENTQAMHEVFLAMKNAGISERDMQTSGFSIQPHYYTSKSSYNKNDGPKITGYSVVNNLTVTIRDLNKVGAVLDQSVTLGVNRGGNIQFTNSDTSKAYEDARIAAVKNAIAKASTLAQAANIEVGDIMELSEQNFQSPRPMMMNARMDSASSMPVPLAAGQNSYSVQVNVTFAIKQ